MSLAMTIKLPSLASQQLPKVNNPREEQLEKQKKQKLYCNHGKKKNVNQLLLLILYASNHCMKMLRSQKLSSRNTMHLALIWCKQKRVMECIVEAKIFASHTPLGLSTVQHLPHVEQVLRYFGTFQNLNSSG